mgnify:CR=1 FL=1
MSNAKTTLTEHDRQMLKALRSAEAMAKRWLWYPDSRNRIVAKHTESLIHHELTSRH